MKNKNSSIRFWLLIGLLTVGLLLTACTSTGDSETDSEQETMENMDDMNQDDMDDIHMDHEDQPGRVPNEGGAAITINSPVDGATFSTLDQVLVEVNVQNFELGVDGNHWHVYVDDVSFGMVMGGNTDQALPGLEPGEHEVSVYMSLGTHEEYEDGDSVTIIVEE
jgi:hypothetical protein